ncbi:MAG: hypothetical protein JNL57_06400 [Bacteroidetes bacterium]|nr:hypothetical protein [Bacteroidota bacterium]
MMRSAALCLTALLILGGCRYEKGPKFSLRSADKRIVRVWVMDKYYDNGVDKTDYYKSLFPGYKLEIKDDNNYTLTAESIIPFKETGTWEWQEGKTKLNLRKNGTGTNVWRVLRLTAKEFWADQVDGNGHTIEYRLKAD